MDVKGVEQIFGSLADCCLHNPSWTPVDVAEVLCAVQTCYDDYGGNSTGWIDCSDEGYWKDGSDSSSYVVVRLKDGWLGLLEESEDFTGHGCQCSASASSYVDLDALLSLGVPEDGATKAIRLRCQPTWTAP